MLHLSKEKKIQLLKFILFLLVFYILARIIIIPFINSVQTQEYVASLGIGGYFIIIGYTVLSHVFAPIAGSPAVFLGMSLYGSNTGLTLLYIASLISSVINFWIAKKYGREMVKKFVGEKAMSEVDKLVAHEGKEVLIMCRLFGMAAFDFISYAAGLTPISFRSYFLITAIFTFIPNFLMRWFLQSVDLKSELGMSIWVMSMLVAAGLFGLLLKLYLSVKQKRANG